MDATSTRFIFQNIFFGRQQPKQQKSWQGRRFDCSIVQGVDENWGSGHCRTMKIVRCSHDLNRRLAGAAIAKQEKFTGVGKTTTTTNDTSVTRPRRRLFRLNICPAPERYLQAAQAQDEDFEENDHDTEQKELLASFHDGATTTATFFYQRKIECTGRAGLIFVRSTPTSTMSFQRVQCQ
jgi:hypothetical protein